MMLPFLTQRNSWQRAVNICRTLVVIITTGRHFCSRRLALFGNSWTPSFSVRRIRYTLSAKRKHVHFEVAVISKQECSCYYYYRRFMRRRSIAIFCLEIIEYLACVQADTQPRSQALSWERGWRILANTRALTINAQDTLPSTHASNRPLSSLLYGTGLITRLKRFKLQ